MRRPFWDYPREGANQNRETRMPASTVGGQLALRGLAPCPLYGCRNGCQCDDQQRAETERRVRALRAAEGWRRNPSREHPRSPGARRTLPEGY